MGDNDTECFLLRPSVNIILGSQYYHKYRYPQKEKNFSESLSKRWVAVHDTIACYQCKEKYFSSAWYYFDKNFQTWPGFWREIMGMLTQKWDVSPQLFVSKVFVWRLFSLFEAGRELFDKQMICHFWPGAVWRLGPVVRWLTSVSQSLRGRLTVWVYHRLTVASSTVISSGLPPSVSIPAARAFTANGDRNWKYHTTC